MNERSGEGCERERVCEGGWRCERRSCGRLGMKDSRVKDGVLIRGGLR